MRDDIITGRFDITGRIMANGKRGVVTAQQVLLYTYNARSVTHITVLGRVVCYSHDDTFIYGGYSGGYVLTGCNGT